MFILTYKFEMLCHWFLGMGSHILETKTKTSDVGEGDRLFFGSRRTSRVPRSRRLSRIKTGAQYAARHVAKVFAGQSANQIYDGRVECDTHADTFVAGRNCTLVHFTERVCDVMPYADDYAPKTAIPIVRAATGYTAANGTRFILMFNEALWMPELEDSLMNPNQLRHFGVEVQDNPYHQEPMVIRKDDDEQEFVACLKTEGTNIFIDTWTPSDDDMGTYKHIELTSPKVWNPHEVRFPGLSAADRGEIEEVNVSAVEVEPREPADMLRFGDQYGEPMKIFDIQAFNYRIMKSRVIETKVSDGPLLEDEMMPPRTFISSKRHSNTTPEDLSEVWNISVEQAKMTLEATTQNHVRSAIMPLSRRYRMDRMFEPKRIIGEMASDTMDPRCESLHGDHRYCQVFGNRKMFCEAYPIRDKTKVEVDGALKRFIKEYGAPDSMITDGSREQTAKGSLFQRTLRKNNIDGVITPPHRPNLNPVETVIRELRKKWYRAIFRTNCPRVIWNYGLPHFARIMQHTATNAAGLEGKTPLGDLTGETPDISQYLDFGWYDWVWFKENAGLATPKLGRFLGIAQQSSNLMTFHILPESGIPIMAGTVQRLTELEKQTDAHKERMKEYSDKIAAKFKEGRLSVDGDKPDLADWEDLLDNDPDFAEEFGRLFDNADVPEADDEFDPDSYDHYLEMELAIDRGGEEPEFARVTKRLKDDRGNPIGTANNNPILDTRMYEVEFVDGHKQAVAANVIAENMFASVDEEGHRHLLLDSIIDTRKSSEAVAKADAYVLNSSGAKRRRETTKGWEVLIQWKDGSTTWSKLKDVKDSYPVEMAEFAIENKIEDEPAFAWWVKYTIKKKNRIISKIKSKYWQRTHKYGIKIPKTIADAIRLDAENGNRLWYEALMCEMKNVRQAFEIHEGDVADLVGYQQVKCHIIWDVKLGENFRRKARLVAGGHTTDAPSTLTYSSVVSRDSVRIALTIAALNDLKVLGCDIQNAYISAPCREKIYTVAGKEFGSDEGKVMVIVRALYGLKSSGAAFRAMLADTLWNLDYRPSLADPDVWLKPAVKGSGFKYYDMVLTYVDDVISISEFPMRAIDGIKAVFKLKGDKAEVPDMYLGGGIQQVANENGTKCWTLSSDKYVKTAVANVEEVLAQTGLTLPSKCATPLPSGYHPAEDVTKELDASGTRYYQELIGVLRWAIELGRVDILLEVALLSSHLALPRVGHLQQVYHIFGYLKKSSRRRLFFDPDHPKIPESRFQEHDWVDFYRDAKEDIPVNAPEPRGKEVSMHCFVDASHASDKATRRSQTGVLIFINRAPIVFYSKRQNSVETSTFGSEFTACKQAVELLKALRYKLRMFGIPLEGAANIYCDNEAVYKNVSVPSSVLNKKMHGISYHYCREAVASGTCRIAKEGTLTNLADLFTKAMGKIKRDTLLNRFMY